MADKLPAPQAIAYPFRKFAVMAEAGVGKTHLAGSFPKPLIAWHFDNIDKADPYLRFGPFEPPVADENGIVYRDIKSAKTNRVLVRLYAFADIDPKDPHAWSDFQVAHSAFVQQIYAKTGIHWQTSVYDSMTSMGLKTRKDQQYRVNPKYKDNRLWRRDTTDEVEELIQISIPALPINAVVIMHIAQQQDQVQGNILYAPNLPGRLRTDIFSQYSEMYRMYKEKDDEGKIVRRLQTDTDDDYVSYTQIGAEDGLINPSYQRIWANWEKRRKAQSSEKGTQGAA